MTHFTGKSSHVSFFSLNRDGFFRYQFNKDKMSILIFLPFGGQRSEDLNIPTSLSIPLSGLYGADMKYQLPSFTVPPAVRLTLPLLGLAEASASISSDLYTWESSFSVGNRTADAPTYVAEFRSVAQSPVKVLAYRLEGKHTDVLGTQQTCRPEHLRRTS